MSRNNCDFAPHMDLLSEVYDKFKKNGRTKKYINDPDSAFYNLVKSEFGMELEVVRFRDDVSKGDIDGLSKRLDNLLNNIEKGDVYSGLAGAMYTPNAFAKADPAIGELLNNFIHTKQHFQGTNAQVNRTKEGMFGNLKKEMTARGYSQNFALTTGKELTRTSAQAKADKIEENIIKTIAEIKSPQTVDKELSILKLQELRRQEHDLYENTEMQVYKEMLDYVENWMPKLTTEKWNELIAIENKKPEKKRKFINYEDVVLGESDFAKIRDENGDPISSNIYSALRQYTEVMNTMHKNLTNGVDAYVDGLLSSKSQSASAERLKEIKVKLKEKMTPNKEAGYYPHYARDLNIDFISGLMPKMDDLVLATSNYSDKPVTTKQALEQLETYISGHAKSRGDALEYSPNFFNVVNTYTSEVNRFNYISHINKSKGDVLNKIESMYKNSEDSGRYIENVVSFVNDLHGAAVGRNAIQNKQTQAFVRTLLGFEFISKIGMNPRSAARNFSQILLNTVEWSPTMILNSAKTIRSMKESLDVDRIMDEKGLLFSESAPELQESLGGQPSVHKILRYNEETKGLEFTPVSKMEKVAGVMSKVAGSKVVAGMTRGIENFNRKLTFRIGFGRVYDLLDNPNFTEFIQEKTLRTRGRKATDKEVESIRQKYATDYGINSVVSLHFDYNDFSKSRAIRGPVGKVLGQFQHYSFKFFEKNWEIARRAKQDLFRGELNSANAWKAYRLGLVYFSAPALISSLTGIDFSRLVEHDLAEKIQKLGAYFMGDDDDRKEAYWGKGPVLGTMGAPVISDLLTLGTLYDVINLDDDSKLRILTGYQAFSHMSDDRKSMELINTLSTSIGRFRHRTLPQLSKGNFGWALQSELGLYPTKKAKDRQKKFKSMFPDIFESLENLEKVSRER